jgi:hypothetical protein
MPKADRSIAVSRAERRHDGLTRLRLVFIGWVVVFHLDLLLRLTIDLPWLRPLIGGFCQSSCQTARLAGRGGVGRLRDEGNGGGRGWTVWPAAPPR